MNSSYCNGVLSVSFGNMGSFTYHKEHGIHKQGAQLASVVLNDSGSYCVVTAAFHDGSRQSFIVEKTPRPIEKRSRFSLPW